MGFSHRSTVTSKDILCKVSEYDILTFYLNINKIPCVINSPLREDNKPSFGLYSLDGEKIYFKDFATGVTGGIFDLFSLIWGLQYREVIDRIYNHSKIGTIKDDFENIVAAKEREKNLNKKLNDLKSTFGF